VSGLVELPPEIPLDRPEIAPNGPGTPPAKRGGTPIPGDATETDRMLTRIAVLAASLALLAGPVLAGDEMNHSAMQAKSEASLQAAGIVEGTLKDGVRTVEMQVTDDGFVPAKIKANKGEKLRLVITRKTEHTCATEIVIKEAGFHINKKLPLNKTVTVELTPKKSGELKYACGMDMISGVIFVP
jgi:plastocyanin